MKKLKIWIEAMRLRTLPVSLSGVLIALGFAKWNHCFRLVPAILCIVFALLAQIVSNFANEYYDYKHGADKKGRVGPRRGVTEGDIKPRTLKWATYGTLVVACCVGLAMLPYAPSGKWWVLVLVGLVTAAGALAYSTGPYPLSYHTLGELAVFIFYGIIPVNFTYYVVAGGFDPFVMMASICIGFMGVNVLLVNNYRDEADDREAGKRTSVVVFGKQAALVAYLFNGFIGFAVMAALWLRMFFTMPLWALFAPAIYLILHTLTWLQLRKRTGAALNPLLGATARNMLIFTILLLIPLILYN
ncbi:MAG: 1,4-dihydroxy-2-naphthoate octaprenyltransferase [Muribaculaceae bacterium]|nr:1,4-dihydroxy-2-naphthoate octaprenyltransferase [Muribaculaceae bacterium]